VVRDRNRNSNRIHRILETAKIKISCVLGKVTGATFRSILEGLATSHFNKPEPLAILATNKRVRSKQEQLRKALRGCRITDHFQFLLRDMLEDLDRLTAKLKVLEERITLQMEPNQELVTRLCEIPEVSRITAWTLIAEIGVDMSRFATTAHLASWCGPCPGNNKSAGKRLSGRGNAYVRTLLVEAARATARITRRRAFFTTLFFRISRRAGMKKAAVAVAVGF
jgi:transposase